MYYVMSDGTPEEVLVKIFRIFDVNSDGVISNMEMVKLITDMYGMLKKEVSLESICLIKTIYHIVKENVRKDPFIYIAQELLTTQFSTHLEKRTKCQILYSLNLTFSSKFQRKYFRIPTY